MLADIDDECELEVQVRWLALARMKEILSLPPPSADDVSVAAQEERELQLHAAQSALPMPAGPRSNWRAPEG
jgi:hypothetical protein